MHAAVFNKGKYLFDLPLNLQLSHTLSITNRRYFNTTLNSFNGFKFHLWPNCFDVKKEIWCIIILAGKNVSTFLFCTVSCTAAVSSQSPGFPYMFTCDDRFHGFLDVSRVFAYA